MIPDEKDAKLFQNDIEWIIRKNLKFWGIAIGIILICVIVLCLLTVI
ncbi:MAG: hypothetical protein ACLPWD_03375 [Methanobacterium sp.]